MRQFTDTEGKPWILTINVSAIRRVRDLLQVDLLDFTDGAVIQTLMNDPIKLCDVLYVVCKPEADRENISDEEFGRRMAGDAIGNATDALLEELVNFCPSPKNRANLHRVLEAARNLQDRAMDMVAAKIGSGALDALAESSLRNASDSLGKLLDGSASTPGSSPSAS